MRLIQLSFDSHDDSTVEISLWEIRLEADDLFPDIETNDIEAVKPIVERKREVCGKPRLRKVKNPLQIPQIPDCLIIDYGAWASRRNSTSSCRRLCGGRRCGSQFGFLCGGFDK